MDEDEIDTEERTLLKDVDLGEGVDIVRSQTMATGVQENLEMTRRHLVDSSSSSDDEDNEGYVRGRNNTQSKWWFMEPAIKKNCWIMFMIVFFIVCGIGCFAVGIILEVIYHSGVNDVIRGIVFIIISILILLPSLYAVIHVYLAAKRVGRVRFSSVWFFRNS